MTASLRSEREAHLVGDVFEEAGKAIRFLGGRDAEALAAEDVVLYGVERAIGNTAEACVQIERGAYAGRFVELFPDHAFDDMRVLGNTLRHDYGSSRAVRVRDTALSVMPALRDRAEALLAAHRRLHGG